MDPMTSAVLAELTWKTVREARYDVAVLPWGATEAHNYHLPYGTDTIETEAVARESARMADALGARAIVLPAVPFGVNTGQLDIPLCLNLNPSTQLMVLQDMAESVSRAGIAKLVILNGHGGNDFRQMIRELTPNAGLFLCAVNWYSCLDPKPFFSEPGDHAGELARTGPPLQGAGPSGRMGLGAESVDQRHRRHRGRQSGRGHCREGSPVLRGGHPANRRLPGGAGPGRSGDFL
jgi:hypothetical protein